MQHLFIINRFAGKKDSYDDIVSQINQLNLENCTIIETMSKSDATKKAREFVQKTEDFVRVYACGGDGTFNEVVNGIYDLENCAIAVIPIGSGNDFIRSFEFSKEDYLNVSNLIDGSIGTIDLIKCNDTIGANSVSLGYDCAVAKSMPLFRRWKFITSSFAYKLSIIYCILNKRKHNFKIIADGKEIKRKTPTYLLSIAAKGKYYGGGIKCAPKAKNDDNYLDFLCVDTIGVLKIISLLTTFMKGEHLDNPKFESILEHHKFKTVEYTSDHPFDIGVDGEIMEVTNAKITVLPNALKVIFPTKQTKAL